MEQAALIGASKTITDPSTGAVIFMTPQGVFGQAPGAGAPQPLTPAQQPPPAGSPSLSAPSAGSAATPSTAASPGQASTRQGMIPLTDAKSSRKPPTEAQQRNQQLYTVVRPELETIEKNFPALSDPKNQAWASLPIGSDYMTTPEFQQARNSLKTIIASYLYSVSGATAAPQEVENQASVLTPKIGEAKASVNDKLARIRTMVNAIKNNRGDIVDPSDGGAKKKTSTGIEWSVEP